MITLSDNSDDKYRKCVETNGCVDGEGNAVPCPPCEEVDAEGNPVDLVSFKHVVVYDHR